MPRGPITARRIWIQLNDPVAAAERIVAFARPGNAEIPVSPAD
jgi:hypothetical protein